MLYILGHLCCNWEMRINMTFLASVCDNSRWIALPVLCMSVLWVSDLCLSVLWVSDLCLSTWSSHNSHMILVITLQLNVLGAQMDYSMCTELWVMRYFLWLSAISASKLSTEEQAMTVWIEVHALILCTCHLPCCIFWHCLYQQHCIVLKGFTLSGTTLGG